MPRVSHHHASNSLMHGGDEIVAWHAHDLARYDPVNNGFAAREESITKIQAGEHSIGATVITTMETSLYRGFWRGARSVGITVFDPESVVFAIPVSWSRSLTINGESAKSGCVYVPSECYCVQGGDRETFGVILRREKFIETIAALEGLGPDDVNFPSFELELRPAAFGKLHMQLLAQIGRIDDDLGQVEPYVFEQEIFGLLLDTYLSACSDNTPKAYRLRRPERIVQKAEDRFCAAGAAPISLADPCSATGVSRSALYRAFDRVYGVAPLAYFHKRRLMHAHTLLQKGVVRRGGVKQAALRAGLTELGRFSVEYRHLFGESPSTTLNKIA